MSTYDLTKIPGFNPEDLEIVESDSALTEVLLTQSTGRALDADVVSFRRVTAGNSFVWNRPGYEFGETNKDVKIEEVGVNDNVHAVRGIIVKPTFGLSLQVDNKENSNQKTICQTESAIYFSTKTNKVEILKAQRPLREPIFQPHDSKETEQRLHTVSGDLMGNTLLKGSRGEYCFECVQRGHHYEGSFETIEGGKTKFEGKVCGHTGELIFCVFEVGIVTQVTRRVNGQSVPVKTLNWVKVDEWMRQEIDEEGETVEVQRYERPFIIRLSAPRSHVFTAPDSARFRIDYQQSSFLESSKLVYNLEAYLKYLASSSVGALEPIKDGSVLYTMLTDIYFVKPTITTEASFGKGVVKGVPVYAPVEAKRKEHTDAAKAARAIYKYERSLAGRENEPMPEELVNFQRPSFSAGSQPTKHVRVQVASSEVSTPSLPAPTKSANAATLPPAELNQAKSEKIDTLLNDLLS